jgi:uncharacterized protein (DUF3084 family)
MGAKSRSGDRACGVLAAVCTAILPVVAEAQDPALDRIEAIGRQIRGLQTELQQLKGELGEAKRQLRQSRNEAQRAQEEPREAREAAERARQDALKAVTAESQVTQAIAPTLTSPASGVGLRRGPPQAQATAAPPAAAVPGRIVDAGPLQASWSWPKTDDLIPGKGQFR